MYDLNIIIFLLLTIICIGLIYLVHKYFGKEEFYFLAIVYSVLSFLMSFKVVKIFGLDINMGIIFSSGLLMILYYFINRFGKKEIKKLLLILIITIFTTGSLFIMTFFMVSSIYDSLSNLYESLVLQNLPVFVLQPISFIITYILSSYCFEQLKLENKNRNLKTIITLVGLIFIDVFVFTYFSYVFMLEFSTSLLIAIDNYLVKTILVIIYLISINKILSTKKVRT